MATLDWCWRSTFKRPPRSFNLSGRLTRAVVSAVLAIAVIGPVTEGGATDQTTGLENSPLTEVSAVSGGRAVLPCTIKPPTAGDSTIMVLFYRGATGTPIYSVDGRSSSSLNQADHWHDPSTLGSRAHFNRDMTPPGLILDPVKTEDQGIYRCRVDFKGSRSRNVRVKLTIVVPPRSITILQSSGAPVQSGLIGPYTEGEVISLSCHALGGDPYPSVSWWYKGALVDSDADSRNGELTINTLTLPPFTRADLRAEVTCQASNTNSTPALSSTVTLDLMLPPLALSIEGIAAPFNEGLAHDVVCEAVGSRPPATISWWRDHAPLHHSPELGVVISKQVFDDGNVTRSTLQLTPKLEDEGVKISCRAENTRLPYTNMEKHGTVTVHYIPRLHLKPGQNIDMTNIKEGADVYFECSIQANPRTYKVSWLHNGEPLHHNVTAGVILSNQSLVLQKLSRESSGDYVCSATNTRGTGHSPPLRLSVKYSPVCYTGEPGIHGGGKHERLNVTCEVEAHPPATSFRWAFNTTAEVVSIDPGRIEAVSADLRNVVYTPRTQLDYGSLLCWASNTVGEQRVPCVFHIIHTAVPDPVHNCTASEVGRNSAMVRCLSGWDGGLPQTFTLSVKHGEPSTTSSTNTSSRGTPRVLANKSSSPKAEFAVTGLEPGKEYMLTVTAVNTRGHSSPVSLTVETLEDKAQKRTSLGAVPAANKEHLSIVPIVLLLTGVIASLTLTCVVIVMVVRSRRTGGQNHLPGKRAAMSGSVEKINTTSSSPGTNQAEQQSTATFIDAEEQSPDIIPYGRNIPTPPKPAVLPGSFTLNQLSLMDIQQQSQQFMQGYTGVPGTGLVQVAGGSCSTSSGAPGCLRSAVALQRTGSLPRSSYGKNARDRCSATVFEYNPMAPYNTLGSTRVHASLHSLHQVDDKLLPITTKPQAKLTRTVSTSTSTRDPPPYKENRPPYHHHPQTGALSPPNNCAQSPVKNNLIVSSSTLPYRGKQCPASQRLNQQGSTAGGNVVVSTVSSGGLKTSNLHHQDITTVTTSGGTSAGLQQSVALKCHVGFPQQHALSSQFSQHSASYPARFSPSLHSPTVVPYSPSPTSSTTSSSSHRAPDHGCKLIHQQGQVLTESAPLPMYSPYNIPVSSHNRGDCQPFDPMRNLPPTSSSSIHFQDMSKGDTSFISPPPPMFSNTPPPPDFSSSSPTPPLQYDSSSPSSSTNQGCPVSSAGSLRRTAQRGRGARRGGGSKGLHSSSTADPSFSGGVLSISSGNCGPSGAHSSSKPRTTVSTIQLPPTSSSSGVAGKTHGSSGAEDKVESSV